MERAKAVSRLTTLVGQDLRQLADQLNVTVWSKDNKKNKGWAGHTIERYLGLAPNSSRSPDFGSWELKLVPLVVRVVRGSRVLRVKETMAITMIDPVEGREFEKSHLFNKLQRIVVVARIFESQADKRSIVHSVVSFDLNDPKIYAQVEADYNLVQETIRTKGFSSLSGEMGKLVQPRTKGQGHGSTSRAFYARKEFVAHILGLRED
jgi:DNA mismatch repair protein MutH